MDYRILTIDYYSEDDLGLYQEIYHLTKATCDIYPGYKEWLFGKFFSGLKDGSRKMLIAVCGKKQLAGVALLKDTKEEKKICTLFVRKDYRGSRIASSLIQESFNVLKTDKPLLTVSDKNYSQLKQLLEINKFKFSYRKNGVYTKDATEHYFNNKATEALKEKILAPLFARTAHHSR